MKALVVNALGRGFDFEDIQIATPIGREVLVDVQASGLCHTDLLFATHDIVPTPAVLGHEVATKMMRLRHFALLRHEPHAASCLDYSRSLRTLARIVE